MGLYIHSLILTYCVVLNYRTTSYFLHFLISFGGETSGRSRLPHYDSIYAPLMKNAWELILLNVFGFYHSRMQVYVHVNSNVI